MNAHHVGRGYLWGNLSFQNERELANLRLILPFSRCSAHKNQQKLRKNKNPWPKCTFCEISEKSHFGQGFWFFLDFRRFCRCPAHKNQQKSRNGRNSYRSRGFWEMFRDEDQNPYLGADFSWLTASLLPSKSWFLVVHMDFCARLLPVNHGFEISRYGFSSANHGFLKTFYGFFHDFYQ